MMNQTKRRLPADCVCDGLFPLCAVCLVRSACALRLAHPQTLSVAILKRRVGDITGREAAILLEASKLWQVRAP